MLSWLRKKGKTPPPTEEPDDEQSDDDDVAEERVPTGRAADVIRRWDAAIADIQRRFDAILDEATTASEPLIGRIETDFGPLDRIWSATEHRMHQHTEEVSERWEETCDALAELDDVDEEVMDREGNKRDLATCEIEIHHTRVYRMVMARAAEDLRRRALASCAAEQPCAKCGAPLARPPRATQAVNVSCPRCSTANVVEPGPLMRFFAASGALFLGQHEAQAAWEAMKRAEIRLGLFRDKRDAPMELLETLESSSRDYWSTLLGVEAQHVPELAPHVAAKIERYMHDVNRTLRQYWQWRQREG